MTPRFLLPGLLLNAFVMSSAPADAETINSVAKRNRSTPVHAFFRYNKAMCDSASNAMATIRRQPKHGKARVKGIRRKLPKTSKICPGVILTGPVVCYTPNRGYTGADDLVVDYRTNAYLYTARMIVRSFGVNVTVK